MVLDERSRHHLHRQLEGAIGAEAAATMMEMLPPVGWADVATKRDLDQLEERMNIRFEAVDHRFEAVDHRFDAIDQRFDAIDHRFDAIDGRFALQKAELIGELRGEIIKGITSQTRTVMFGLVGSVVSMAGLAFGLVKLG